VCLVLDVRSLINEPSYDAARSAYGVPLTPSETSQMRTADQSPPAHASSVPFNRASAVSEADYYWDSSSRTRAWPYSPFDNDFANYVSTAWHFGGGLNMTKHWYISRDTPPFLQRRARKYS